VGFAHPLRSLDRQAVSRALLTFAAWRGALFAFALVGLSLSSQRRPVLQRDPHTFPDHYFWDGFFRWDSVWFKSIAEQGYFIDGVQNNVVFFPLFPYLSRYLGYLVGGHEIAGLLIANAATAGALYFLLRIGAHVAGRDDAERAVVLLLCFPTSLFLSAYYSEGLFLLTLAASLWGFLQGRYLAAGLWGALASATRSTGALLLPVYALCLGVRLWRRRDAFSGSMLGVLLVPIGTLVFMLLLHVQVGDAFAFIEYQKGWGREAVLPWVPILDALGQVDFSFPRSARNTYRLIDAVFTLGLLACLPGMIRRLPPPLWLFTGLALLAPLVGGTVTSMPRYAIVLFPIFLYLSLLARNRSVERLLVYGFSLLLGLFSLRFMNWFWVA
jgi:hypothetical protein